MKAIKDCEWIVGIVPEGINTYRWQAISQDDWSIGINVPLKSSVFAMTATEVKLNWQHFAKLNGIKKWKYV